MIPVPSPVQALAGLGQAARAGVQAIASNVRNAVARVANFFGNMKETIGNYVEIVVLLVLAPLILSFWSSFKSAVPADYQNLVDALTVLVVLGIAISAVAKVTSD